MKKAEILMIEACDKTNLPVAAFGFTEDWREGTILYPFKPFTRFSDMERGFLGGISPQSGNRGTLALQWAVDQLAQYPEDIHVLNMLSDGEPCFNDGEDYETMKSIVLQAEKGALRSFVFMSGPIIRARSNVHMRCTQEGP